MAKVNKKFLFVLTGGILCAVGLTVGAMKIVFKSPVQLAKTAKQFADKEDYSTAAIYISKAVNKDQANIEYLTTWVDYLRKSTPKDETRANDSLLKLRTALNQLAVVQRDNVDAQHALLDLAWQMAISGGEYTSYNGLADVVTTTAQMLSYHEGKPAGNWQTLERFRGWALTNMIVISPDAKQDQITQAMKSLEIAAAADPKDVRTALKLEELLSVLAARAEASNKPEESMLLTARAQSTLDGFVSLNPESPEALMRKLQREIDPQIRALIGITDTETRENKAREIVTGWNARLAEMLALVKSGKRSMPDTSFRGSFREIEKRFMPGVRFAQSKALLSELMSREPQSPDLIMELAHLQAESNDFTSAIVTMESMLALPPLRVSIEGTKLFQYRTVGVFYQALWTIKSADEPGLPAEERSNREKSARELKVKLDGLVDSDNPTALLINAYISFMDGKNEDAGRFIDRFHAKRRDPLKDLAGNEDSNWLNGLVQSRLNKPGEAYKSFAQCLRFNPQNVQAALEMASIDARLQQYDRALEILNQLLTLAPGYEDAENMRKTVLMSMGQKVSDDPVINSLLGADQMARELANDPDGLRKIEEYLSAEAKKFNDDYRLVRALGLLYLRSGERDKAIIQLEKAIASKPDDADAKSLLLRARGGGMEADLAAVDSSGSTDEILKCLTKMGIYRRAGRREEAAAELEKAKEINADDPRVIEIEFVNAIDDRNVEVAESLVQKGIDKNVDGRNGLTFRARVATAKGDFTNAIALLQQAISLGNASPELYRMLGRAYSGVGNNSDSIKQFELALDARPNDALSINDLMIAYMQSDRKLDALRVARAGEKYAADNSAFRNLYNLLESEVGDKGLAMARRERVASMDPSDRRNLVELSLLYLDFSRWADAAKSIDAVAAVSEGLDVIGLRAELLWRQDKVAEGRKVFTDHIATLTGSEALNATLLYADFLLRKDKSTEAIDLLKQARASQDPKVMGVDRVLAEILFARGMYAEAAIPAKAIVDAKLDTDNQYLLRYAECLTRSGSHSEALAAVDAIAKTGQEDMATLLIKADASGGLGKADDQRRYLDQAVTRFPNQSIVFRQRGQFLLSRRYDNAQEQRRSAADAKEDFDQAIRLKPDDWELLRLRALAHVSADPDRGLSAAIEDSRAALRLNPDNEELLYGLLADLIRFDRVSEALVVAEENLARKPNDRQMLGRMGDLFVQYNRPAESVRFLRAAFDLDRNDPSMAQPLIDALFAQNPPALTDAEAVLEQAKSIVDRNPGLLMAKARILLTKGRVREADRFAFAAVKLLDARNSRQILAWFNDIKKAQPDVKVQLGILDSVESLGVGAEISEWMRFLRANIKLADPATNAAGIEEIRKLSLDAKLSPVNQMSFRFLGSTYYGAGNYAEAARTWESALAKFPDDAEAANNLAYTYLKHLDRKADALSVAERAAKILTASPDVQDTYGLALLANGRTGEAIAIMRNAVLLASDAQSEVITRVHLAQALIAGGDETEARQVIRAAMQTASEPTAQVNDSTRADLEAIKKTLGI